MRQKVNVNGIHIIKTAKTTKFIAMLAGALLLGGALIPLTSYAESNATVSVSATIPSALSMYIDNNDGKGDVGVTEGGSNIWTKAFELYPGGYTTDQFTKITVRTNAPQGYSVTLQGVSDGTRGYADLVMGDGLEDNSSITSSDATPGADLAISTWGVRVTKDSVIVADNDYDREWQAVPDSTSGNIEIDASEEANGSSITYVYYGIAASRTQAAGSYTGTVRYTMTANSTNTGSTGKLYMQTMSFDQCAEDGVTVYDSRYEKDSDGNDVSYTVKLITLDGTPTCWMMSNLQLPGGTTLTSSDSNVTSNYTLPADTGSSGWVNDYCKPYMATAKITLNNTETTEYYYNWPAATARTNSTSSTSPCSNDTSNSVGDICPNGWRLPKYYLDNTTTTPEAGNSTWRSNLQSNGGLAYTGHFLSGTTNLVGSNGFWWTSTRNGDTSAYDLFYSGTAGSLDDDKYNEFSVRCMRTS